MAKQLYKAVVWKRDRKEPKNDKIVFRADDIEATSQENARILAIRSISNEDAADLDALEVNVSPF